MKVKVEDVEDSKPLILNQNDNGLKRRRRSFNEDAGSPPPKRQYLGDTSESIVPKAEKPGVQVRNKTLPPPIAPPKPKSAAQKKKTGPKSQKKTPQKNRVWLGIKRQDPVILPNKASNERLNAVFAAAAKNAIKVDGLDYAAMAKVRDKAMPGSRTFSNTEESFPLSKALPNYLPPQ
ncbi:hypothetical protein DL93DRAFT_219937 [Clavulina sp. PMI_390]|nr:hypothetical protein DL93DRAFT_219937 [Clavulina sp. PMI_390]